MGQIKKGEFSVAGRMWSMIQRMSLQPVDHSSACLLFTSCDDATTSHQCFASCTGFQCGSTSTTRSSRSFIGVCPATSQATWLTTADLSPTPASDDCVLQHWLMVVGRIQSSFGDRTFAAAAPRLWNSLLSDIRQPDLSYVSLKTFLFGAVWPRRDVTCVN